MLARVVLFLGFYGFSSIALCSSINLAEHDFPSQGIIQLKGPWDFYWNRLIPPGDVSPPDTKALIPGFWARYEGLTPPLNRSGVASYRLRLSGLPKGVYRIKVDTVNTAYRLYINGQLYGGAGTVSTSLDQVKAAYKNRSYSFQSQAGQTEILFHLANRDHYLPGFKEPILLGLESQMENYAAKALAMDLFLAGSLMIIGAYHLVFFMTRKEDKTPLFFSLFCLLIGLRTLVVGERFGLHLVDMSWEWISKSNLFILYLAIWGMAKFFKHLFPQEARRSLLGPLSKTSLLLSLVSLLVPSTGLRYSVWGVEIVILLCLLSIILVIIRAYKAKRPGTGLIILGFFALSVTSVNDIFYQESIISTGFLASYGLLAMVFTHALALGYRFADSFTQVESLSKTVNAQAEVLKDLDRSKDEFLAKTAHELKTPIHGMIGLGETALKQGQFTEPWRGDLEVIVASGRRLEILIDNLLDFARLRFSNITINLQPVHVPPLVAQVLALMNPYAQEKRLQLRANLAPNLPAVWADEARLVQILINLVTNSIKHTSEGSVTLQVWAEAPPGNKVCLSVTDTGPGINPGLMPHLFEPFTSGNQFDNAGTGLGLHIVKELLDLMQGEIQVNNQPGQGVCFTLGLPRAEVEPSPEQESSDKVPRRMDSQPQLNPLPGKNRPQLLLVDDEPVNLRVLTRQLEGQYDLLTATDGLQALELLEETNPDMLLLDLFMPHLDGFETLKKIRSDQSRRLLPVLVLTASNNPAHLERAFKLGANDYLSKPFRNDELLSRIKVHLEVSQGRVLKQELLQRLAQNSPQPALPYKGLDRQEEYELELREAVVRLMKFTLKAWLGLGQGKQVELAEKSGLWNVQIDQGRLRTRTLDKYLDVEKLPRCPRYTQVIDTARWVAEQLPDQANERAQLALLSSQLEANLI